jgi:hypothetical protein
LLQGEVTGATVRTQRIVNAVNDILSGINGDSVSNMEEEQVEISRSGWMRKKGSRGNTWGDRYFVLKGRILNYYQKQSDTEPRGSLLITSACRISEIRSDIHKKKKQYIFRIVWPSETSEDADDNNSVLDGEDGGVTPGITKERKSFFRGRHTSKDGNSERLEHGREKGGHGKAAAGAAGGVVAGAMTAGVGLLAGMMYSGMSSSHRVNDAFSAAIGPKDKSVVLACEVYAEAEAWLHAIDEVDMGTPLVYACMYACYAYIHT